jgi:hypothetical protein
MEMKNICLGSRAAEGEKFIELEVIYSDNSECYVITAYFRSDWGTWVALSEEDWKEVEGYIYDDGVEDWKLTLCDGDGTVDDLILIGQRYGDVYFAIGDIDNVEFWEEEE